MIEPFHELNSTGIRRHYIESNQYFDAQIESLLGNGSKSQRERQHRTKH